ncbi:bifunctional DNA-formamidopyrimidine glycosylase/DNA-(apurinic or apyrimidinic site) lyase [Azohydromonas caseinilytica]|uniref:Formamidopyrimidine-DNA glycosylase n=1 Tax=Azohydromonas caseinilytica TaxID=2728836 RepID=A0A848F3W7_9BURK|nr:bifunctional DNA-formamidopyrimidine glycosylase/DNA-(apurinic or apyrimidinic site) lyase [Azohydromonas caseinilytica]NML13395.1 bifunctional DNA-formamidopyrimidine glycosylase/DNA-(apurinic or apyrimidinic site) lyase [Azohydromonas caseinilytica]
MPELPEVEVTRRSVAPRLEGALVRAVRVGAALRWPLGVEPASLVSLRIGPLQRRGKYIWLPLLHPDGAPQGGLLLHLGMSGSLAFLAEPAAAPGKHEHFDLVTDAGTLRLTDPRRFGAVVWSPALDQGMAARLLARLGREPFDPALTPALLRQGLQRRSVPIKTALLAGDIVVGAGNIYACEALYEAGIDPRTPANALTLADCERLLAALRDTLGRALELGGSTLRDFRDAHGMSGAFQDQAGVYGREGQPCRRCGTPVQRLVQGQRSTFFCPSCQRR